MSGLQNVRGVLLDIEGTTSAISFVYDIMFPFARRELAGYLEANWGSNQLSPVVDQIAQDAGHENLLAWQQSTAADGKQLVGEEIIRLMDADIKATGLKQLQGLIWQAGFESGEMQAHVFDDVPPAINAWRAADIDLRIYSSGSIHAQQLFFGHTIAGNLLPHFSGHYDTTTGPKREAASYQAIAKDWGIAASEILFLSDVVAELNAAREAQMQTALVIRPGNAEVEDRETHQAIESFAELS